MALSPLIGSVVWRISAHFVPNGARASLVSCLITVNVPANIRMSAYREKRLLSRCLFCCSASDLGPLTSHGLHSGGYGRELWSWWLLVSWRPQAADLWFSTDRATTLKMLCPWCLIGFHILMKTNDHKILTSWVIFTQSYSECILDLINSWCLCCINKTLCVIWKLPIWEAWAKRQGAEYFIVTGAVCVRITPRLNRQPVDHVSLVSYQRTVILLPLSQVRGDKGTVGTNRVCVLLCTSLKQYHVKRLHVVWTIKCLHWAKLLSYFSFIGFQPVM